MIVLLAAGRCQTRFYLFCRRRSFCKLPRLRWLTIASKGRGTNLGSITQVLPHTHFFLFTFYFKKSLICLDGKSMTPCQGGYSCISFVPPSNSLVSDWTLGGLFELTQWHFKGPRPRLVCCFRNYRDTRTTR